MSFKCGVCKQTSEPGEPATRIVTETRPRTYPFRAKVFRMIDPETKRTYFNDDPGGKGWEIVKEMLTCTPCAARLKATIAFGGSQ